MAKHLNWQFDMEGFVRAVAGKRTALNITLREAADQMGSSPATLHRIETQNRVPDVSTVIKVCQWLGVTVDAFVVR